MNLINLIFNIVLAICFSPTAFGSDTVIHPTPKTPIFLSESIYTKLKSEVAEPPQPGSEAQLRDEAELFKAQLARTEEQCRQAEFVVLVSLKSFYGQPMGPLTDKEVIKLTSLFEQIRNDGDFFIQKMKVDFPRQRPFLYISGLEPCVRKEVTGAYPSGHAALSTLYALILSDLFPEHAAQFKQRADEIAQSRILSGMHHPSDIESGKELGAVLYKELKQSLKFKKALKEAKGTL